MRTTIDIPDQLFRRVKQAAAEQGVALREIVLRALTTHLDPRPPAYRFDWKVFPGEWNADLPLHSREALEDYLGSWRTDLYG